MKRFIRNNKLSKTLLFVSVVSLAAGLFMNFSYTPSNIYNYYTLQLSKCLKKDYRSCEGEVTVYKYVMGRQVGTYRPQTLDEIGYGYFSSKDYYKLGMNHYSLIQRDISESTIFRNTGVYKSSILKRDAFFLPLEAESLSAHYSLEKQNLVSQEVMQQKFSYQNIINTGSGGSFFLIGLESNSTTVGVGSVQTTYTPMGLPKSVDRFGVLTTFDYFNNGDLAKKYRWADGVSYLEESYSSYKWGVPQLVEGPYGRKSSLVVDDNGFVVSKTNGMGHTVRYEYDLNGREVLRSPQVGLPTQTSYPDGLTTVEKRGELVVTRKHNSMGQEIEMVTQDTTRGLSLVKATDYNGAGLVSFERDIEQGVKSTYGEKFTYDVLGRVQSILDVGDSAQTLLSYQSPDLVVETKPSGHKVKTYFKNFGAPNNETIVRVDQDIILQPLNPEDVVTTQMTVALDGKLTQIKQNGITRLRNYDSSRRLGETVDPEKSNVSMMYYAGSELLKLRQIGSAFAIGYKYDLAGRLKTVEYPNAQENIVYDYNNENVVTSVSSGGVVRTFDFDGNGNKTFEELSIDGYRFRFDFTYDSTDRMKTVTYPDVALIMGGVTSRNQMNVSQMDALGRPLSIADQTTTLLSSASYHPNGYFNNLSYGNGATTAMTLTPNQLPLKVSIKSGTKGLNLKYTYDQEDHVISIENTGDERYLQQLKYDGVNRLTSSTFPNGADLMSPTTPYLGGSISYTPTGDILSHSEFGKPSTTLTYNGQNQLQQSNGAETHTYQYDSRGNITSDSRYKYQYDFRGNLVSVTPISTSAPLAVYGYDGNDVRVRKISAGVTTYYFYINNKLYFEASPQKGIKEYFYSGKNLIATRTILKTAPTPQYTYFHFNPVQSTVATSTQSLSLNREYYNSYGSSLVSNPNFEKSTEVRFAGHLTDDETDLIYMGNRYYNPKIGRFLQMDSVDFQGDNPHSFNRYAYANNNPHTFIDPDGKNPIAALAFLAVDAAMIGYDLYHENYASAALTLAMAPLGVYGTGARLVKGSEAARVATEAAAETGLFKMFVETGLGSGREIFPRMQVGEYYHAVFMMERGSSEGKGFWALGKGFERNLSHGLVGDIARQHYPHCTMTFCGGIRFAEKGLEISGRAGRSDSVLAAIKIMKDVQKTFKIDPVFVSPGRLPPLGK